MWVFCAFPPLWWSDCSHLRLVTCVFKPALLPVLVTSPLKHSWVLSLFAFCIWLFCVFGFMFCLNLVCFICLIIAFCIWTPSDDYFRDIGLWILCTARYLSLLSFGSSSEELLQFFWSPLHETKPKDPLCYWQKWCSFLCHSEWLPRLEGRNTCHNTHIPLCNLLLPHVWVLLICRVLL